ncbi:MAG: gamma-glutamylcyclotransferase family protein [Gammaproteobacteria bacterium]|nr:gamma-glutamylcyclotransferase family protein [Gammaproteobacteria bacterium]MDP6731856.1 gamma-glutamylcyclotransferase family protein [Gammaproteobacteria bacterium]
MKGILYDQGWGAPLGCPGIVLGEHGESVRGFLFSSEDLIDHWSRLDDFEGSAYQRVTTLAHLDDGSTVETQIYVLAQSPAE